MLGGTGHIGAAIAHRFAQAGYHVVASGRRPGHRANLAQSGVEIVLGDDHLPGVAEAWIALADLVVDAATPYPIWAHQDQGSDPVAPAVARTHRLLDACARRGAGFVHISSFTTLPRPRSALGQIGQGALRGMHRYFDLKSAVEIPVRAALEAGQPGCVVHPATCFGPYDLKPVHQAFIPMLLAGKVGGLVRQDLNVIDVRDVAEIVFAAHAQRFPITQIPAFGHNISLADLATRICEIGGARTPRIKVPPMMGLAALYWMETAMAMAGQKTPWPSLPMMLTAASYSAPQSAAQMALYPSLRPLEQTLRDSVAWYRQR